MNIPMAFLADEANISQEGKLNVMGIFDRIVADDLPVTHPRMVFAFRVTADFTDGGRSFPVQVRMVDEDGAVMFDASGEINPPMLPPGEFSTANQVFTLVGMQFPRAGQYQFEVRIGDLEPHVTPFVVGTAPYDNTLN